MTTEFPDLNFGDVYDAVAKVVPERTAIIYGEKQISWKVFDERTNRLARSLLSRGLTTNSKVAFYLRNCPAYVELWATCAKGRFVHANINYRYVDHELLYLLENSDAEAVVYDSEFRSHVEALQPKLPQVKAWLEVGAGVHAADFAEPYDALCAEGDPSPLDIERSGDDLYLMYTGGTTGYPKGVMWPARNRIAAIRAVEGTTIDEHVQSVLEQESQPVSMPAAPMMHSMGLTTTMSNLCRGGCLVVLPTRGFDAEVCVREIEKHRVQRLSIAGDAFALPLAAFLRDHSGQFDLSSLLSVSSAGTMWSEHLKQELLEYLPQITITDALGSSEGSGLGRSERKRGSSGETGRFKAGAHVKLLREDMTEVTWGSGEAGLLAVAGPLPIGYYKDPEKTAQTFPVIEGIQYSVAGDWCRIDADGNMTLLGRGSNCINTGGEKVYPEEVEEALKQVTNVVDAAVAAVPNERFGQAVGAVITTQGGSVIAEDVLRAQLENYIARYKHPRHVVFLDNNQFRHDNGKVNYREVKRLLEQQLEGETAFAR